MKLITLIGMLLFTLHVNAQMKQEYINAADIHNIKITPLHLTSPRGRIFQMSPIELHMSIEDPKKYLYIQEERVRKMREDTAETLGVLNKFLDLEYSSAPDVCNGFGKLWYDADNYPQALNYFQQCLQEVPSAKHIAVIYNYMGTVYKMLGNYQEALKYYKKSLKIREEVLGTKHIDTADSYHSFGLFYMSISNVQKALKYFEKSLVIREKVLGTKHIDTADSYHSFGLFYRSIGNVREALKYFKKSLSIREKVLGKKHIDTADSYNDLGLLYYYMKNYYQALEYFQKSLSILEEVLGTAHTKTATNYNDLGELYKSMGNYFKAYIYAKKSYDIFLKNRDKNFIILNNNQKKLYLKSNSMQISSLLNSIYMYSNKMNKNIASNKLTLYRTTLTDWLNYKGSVYDFENAMVLLYENTSDLIIKSNINKLHTKKRYLAKLYQSPQKDEEVWSYRNHLIAIKEEISNLEQIIASKVSSFQENLGLHTVNYTDISKHLKPKELYIDYAKTEDYYYIFTLDADESVDFIRIDTNDTAKIDSTISSFLKDIDTISKTKDLSKENLKDLTSQSQKKLSTLYNLAIAKPLGEKLKQYNNLIISPDGALRLIPFESFYNVKTSQYFIEEKSILYIPSGKELLRLNRQKKSKASSQIVVFANPNYDAGSLKSDIKKSISSIASNVSDTVGDLKDDVEESLNYVASNVYNFFGQFRSSLTKSIRKMKFEQLPGSLVEAQDIKKIFKNSAINLYTDDNASETNLLQIQDAKILHISTHGFFINDENITNPMLKSGIVLAGANTSAKKGKDKGIVTSLKLSGLHLKNTDMVVLSACETGVVNPKDSELVSGLNKAFIQAGASNVVMSLWSVNDAVTAELMKIFYENIKENKGYGESLRSSKLLMIKEKYHPFYWAPFIISGTGE